MLSLSEINWMTWSFLEENVWLSYAFQKPNWMKHTRWPNLQQKVLANFIVWMLYQTMEVSHFMLQLTCHANYICKNIWIFGDFNAIPENKSTSWIFKVCKTWLKTKFVLSQQTVLWLSISNDKQVSISKPNSFESPYSNRYGAYNNLWKISTKVTIVPKLRTFLEWLFYK